MAQSVKARGEAFRGEFCLSTFMGQCCSCFCCCTTSVSSQQLLCLLSCTALLGLQMRVAASSSFFIGSRDTHSYPLHRGAGPPRSSFYFDRVRVLLLSRLALESLQLSCLSSSAKITRVPLSFTLFNLKIESCYISYPGPNHVAQSGLELQILSFS